MTESRSLSKSCRSKLTVGNAQEPRPGGKSPARDRKGKARIVALTATAGALAMLATVASAAPDTSAASGAAASAQPRVVFKPEIVQLAYPVRATVASTAQCQRLYRIACYQPDQIRTA